MKPKHSPLQDLIGRASGQLGLSLGRDQIDSLVTFERLLRDRAVPLGMIARSDRDRMMRRHVIDCLRAAVLVRPEDREALDLGSGAGLPGLVMAIACPHLHVGLVEARRRRAAFLELAAHELGLPNVAILVRRAESLEAGADLATARALAPLDRAWALAEPLLRPGGRLLHFSGPLAGSPAPPPRASEVQVVAEFLIDSPGPIVIIRRQ